MLLRESTLLHVLWLAHPEAVLANPFTVLPHDMPQVDCVFITIAEDSRHTKALQAADVLADALGYPVINRGSAISRLSRDGAARLLADVVGALVPQQHLIDVAELRLAPPVMPFIIRPNTSHAGHALSKVDCKEVLDVHLSNTEITGPFFVAPFINFQSADGFFRKYRVVFVNGIPYPVHLAIHDDWKVWYYNAGMDREAWKRAEEERFMADMPAAVGEVAMGALMEIGRRLPLDYVGLDCAVLPDSRLLVFEVETGMIVHDRDPVELFPYKKVHIPRIFSAVERMIDMHVARHPCYGSGAIRPAP